MCGFVDFISEEGDSVSVFLVHMTSPLTSIQPHHQYLLRIEQFVIAITLGKDEEPSRWKHVDEIEVVGERKLERRRVRWRDFTKFEGAPRKNEVY